jgi:hypothetical protein
MSRGRGIGALVLVSMVGALVLVPKVGAAPAGGIPPQTALEVADLARYRLTNAVFVRFDAASRAIATATQADPAFALDPLFTREIMLTDDVAAAARALETRLEAHPALVAALRAEKLSARDYTQFALTMFAARLVHGFVKTGLVRSVPKGAAAANVAFVQAHETAITAVLAALDID